MTNFNPLVNGLFDGRWLVGEEGEIIHLTKADKHGMSPNFCFSIFKVKITVVGKMSSNESEGGKFDALLMQTRIH